MSSSPSKKDNDKPTTNAVDDIDIDANKATPAMRQTLQDLRQALLCPLCHNLMTENPSSLPACGHTFCQGCIDKYCNNHWGCPECNMPVAMRGEKRRSSDKQSFRQINPAYETVVSSYQTICQALSRAPDRWWEDYNDDDDDDHNNAENIQTSNNNNNNLAQIDEDQQGGGKDDNEMIDLQANETNKTSSSSSSQQRSDNDCSDDDEEDFATARDDLDFDE